MHYQIKTLIIRIGILIPILFLSIHILNLNSKEFNQEYEIKIFITDDYCLSCNKLIMNQFQYSIESLKVNYNWNVVNSNTERFNYIKDEGIFRIFKNLHLDTLNNKANDFNLVDFPIIILLKNKKVIYKTNNFVFNNIKEVLSFDSLKSDLELESKVLDVKKIINCNDDYYILDGIKNEIFKHTEKYTEIINIKHILDKYNYKLFGDITLYDLYIIENKPFSLIKFNTLEENEEIQYHEIIIDLELNKIVNLLYDNKSYIIGDKIHKICDNFTYTCFHYDYYESEDSRIIKNQPIIASLNSKDSVRYHSSIKEIEMLINEDYKYLYVLKSISINNYFLILEPSLGISLYTKYDCDINKLEPFEHLDFQNEEVKKLFNDLKITEPYSSNLSNDADYYLEGINKLDKNNIVLVFRSKIENQDGLIEYKLYIYDNNLKFINKKEYFILNNEKNEKLINTFFIPNLENKIIFGLKYQSQPFKIYEPNY